MQKSYIVSGILIIIIIILIKQQDNDKPLQLAQNDTQEYMLGLKLYDYNEQGALKNFISAVAWKFTSNKRQSLITKPDVTIYKYPNYLYNIQAESGHVIHKELHDQSDLIKLTNNVRVKQQYLDNSSKKSGFTLTTEYLEITPETGLATTDQYITIYKPGLMITGIGMNANLKLNQLEIHKDVQTKYQNKS